MDIQRVFTGEAQAQKQAFVPSNTLLQAHQQAEQRRTGKTLPLSQTIKHDNHTIPLLIDEEGQETEWMLFTPEQATVYLNAIDGMPTKRSQIFKAYSPLEEEEVQLERPAKAIQPSMVVPSVVAPPIAPPNDLMAAVLLSMVQQQERQAQMQQQSLQQQMEFMTKFLQQQQQFPLTSQVQQHATRTVIPEEEPQRGRMAGRSPPRVTKSAERDIMKVYDEADPNKQFPLRVAKLAALKYSKLFAEQAIKPDYDPLRWTWSTNENMPVYVHPNHTAAQLHRARVVRTEAVLNFWNQTGTFARFNNNTQRDQTYLNDTDPKKVLPSIVEQLPQSNEEDKAPRLDIYSPQQEHSVLANQKTILSALHDNVTDPLAIELAPNYQTSINSINKEYYQAYYPQSNKLNVVRHTTTYFDGMLTYQTIEIDENIPDIPTFVAAMAAYVDSRLALEQPISPDHIPAIIGLSVFYVGFDADRTNILLERAIQFWRGLATQKPDFSLLREDLQEILQDMGYDYQPQSKDFSLDLTRFRYSKLELIRTGSGKTKTTNFTQLLENKKIRCADLVGAHTLCWANIYAIKPVGKHTCFAQALNHFLLECGARPKASKFTTLYQEVGHESFNKNHPVNIEEAGRICDSIGLHCEIYDSTGKLLQRHNALHAPNFDVKDTNGSINEVFDNTLRLLLCDGHYINIVGMPEKVTEGNVDTKYRKVNSYKLPVLLTYYDLETVVDESRHLVPYSNAFCANLPIDALPSKITTTVLETPSLDVFRPMLNALMTAGPGYMHRVIAYNGSSFDHILFYKYLLQMGARMLVGANPKGKGQSFTAVIKCQTSPSFKDAAIASRMKEWRKENPKASAKVDQKAHARIIKIIKSDLSYVTVWDTAMFARTSLANAARSYKTEALKLGFDHELVQREYRGKGLKHWLESHRDVLEEYNINDVVVLSQLTDKLLSALTEITGISRGVILTKPSISNLAWTFWKSNKEVSENYPPVGLESIDKLIRGSLIAGRTEGIVGHHKFPGGAVLVDVVSLYPTVMERCAYPAGEELVVYDPNEKAEHYKNGTPGFYFVSWDQSSLHMSGDEQRKALHPILPVRGETLDWKSMSKESGLLPYVTIDQLLALGAMVLFATPPKTPIVYETVLKEGADVEECCEAFKKKHGGCLTKIVRGKTVLHWTKDLRVHAIVWPDTVDNEHNPFTWYVKKLSSMKNQQDVWSKSGDPQYNPALREMIKMLLNAISGKVIQRNYDNQFKLVQGTDSLHWAINKIVGHAVGTPEDMDRLVNELGLEVEYVTSSVVGGDYANVMWKESSFSRKSKPSQLGVYIYAHARALMYSEVYSRCKVYYSDTDSALISVDDYIKNIRSEVKCEELVLPVDRSAARSGFRSTAASVVAPSRITKKTICPKAFGVLEIEVGDGGVFVFDAATVIAPKTYCLWRDGKVVKYRCKGVRESDTFVDGKGVEKSIADNKEEFFNLLLANGKGKTEVHTWNFNKRWSSNLGLLKNNMVKWI